MVRSTAVVLALAAALGSCARAAPDAAPAARRISAIARPLEAYQELGFMVGSSDFPAVGSFASLAGPADSTYVLFALSLPNSALRFTREGSGFAGEYNVTLMFMRDSTIVRRVERREQVRVSSFAETGRTDESIIFQDFIALAPGRYEVSLTANDVNSAHGFRARDTIDVPSFGRATELAAPLIVYQARGRTSTSATPELVANARGTVPYGSEVPRVYLELYNAQMPQTVELRVVDETGQPFWQARSTVTEGNAALRHTTVDIPTAALPLGRLWIEANTADANAERVRSPLLITISDQWIVANFDEVLRFIEFIALPAELDSLRGATGAEQRELWDRFWSRRDPLSATPINEFRDEFFQRVRFVTENFAEPGKPGWDTDRGEVYIVLGNPDHIVERTIGRETGRGPNAVEWLYDRTTAGRFQLLFIDRTGLGRYEITPQSEQAFRAAALRLKPKASNLE